MYAAPPDKDEIAKYQEAGANRAIINLTTTLEGQAVEALEKLAEQVLR